jgi:hypothetical protein
MMLHILLHLPFHSQVCGSMLVCWASSSSGSLHQIKVLYHVLTQAPHTLVSTKKICSLCRLRQQSGYEIASSELHCILSGIHILATLQYYHSIPLCFSRAFHTDEHRDLNFERQILLSSMRYLSELLLICNLKQVLANLEVISWWQLMGDSTKWEQG